MPTLGRALVWSVALAKGLPYLLFLGCWLISNFLPRASGVFWSMGSLLLGSFLPQLITALFYLLLIQIARSQLLLEVSGQEPQPLNRMLIHSVWALRSRINQVRQWPHPST
jgi:hypothetical protein